MEIASPAVPEDPSRAWLILKVQAVFHAALSLVVGIVPLYLKGRGEGEAFVLAAAYCLLLATWLYTLYLLRAKSTRLRRELPRPEVRPRSLMLGAFPCLQLLGLLVAAALPKDQAEMVYGLLALSGLLLFVLVLLSGICFGLAAVPIRWGAWGLALGSSLVVGVVLIAFALQHFHWTC